MSVLMLSFKSWLAPIRSAANRARASLPDAWAAMTWFISTFCDSLDMVCEQIDAVVLSVHTSRVSRVHGVGCFVPCRRYAGDVQAGPPRLHLFPEQTEISSDRSRGIVVRARDSTYVPKTRHFSTIYRILMRALSSEDARAPSSLSDLPHPNH